MPALPPRPLRAALIVLLLGAPSAEAGNVILFVGDGTSLPQLAAARVAAQGADGRLALDALEEIAVVTTHSASGWTTDSASGATAWSTGRKTTNGFLAVAPDSTRLETLLEEARDAGYATGLVTTTTLTHATPAAFASHVPDRGAQNTIAEQMLATAPYLMLGGGRAHWVPQDSACSRRDDDVDLVGRARAQGYRVISTAAALQGLDARKAPPVLGLFADGHLPYRYDRGDDSDIPTLAAMTQFSLDALSAQGRPGFLLVVEGGRVDHGAHANDGTRTVWEAIALDEAVARAIAFAQRRKDTLVLLTGDHETGGMAVGTGHYQGFPEIPRERGFPVHAADLDSLLHIGWSTTGHSALPVLALAMGRESAHVRGVLDNTDLHGIMRRALGLQGR